eukprot:scpid78004/ scgid10162/ 
MDLKKRIHGILFMALINVCLHVTDVCLHVTEVMSLDVTKGGNSKDGRREEAQPTAMDNTTATWIFRASLVAFLTGIVLSSQRYQICYLCRIYALLSVHG